MEPFNAEEIRAGPNAVGHDLSQKLTRARFRLGQVQEIARRKDDLPADIERNEGHRRAGAQHLAGRRRITSKVKFRHRASIAGLVPGSAQTDYMMDERRKFRITIEGSSDHR